MFKKWKTILCLVTLTCSWAGAVTQDLAMCLDEQTSAVLRLNVPSLNISKSLVTLTTMAEKNLPTEHFKEVQKTLAHVRQTMGKDLVSFEKAGGRDIYALFSMRDLPDFFLACPVPMGVDAKDLQKEIQAIADRSFRMKDLEVQVVRSLILVGKTRILEAIKKQTRGDSSVESMLQEVNRDIPLQVTIAPSASQLRVVKEMWPALPDVPAFDQLGELIYHSRSLTLHAGIVPKLVLNLRIEMQTEATADQLLAFWKVAVPMLAKSVLDDTRILQKVPAHRQDSEVNLQVDGHLAEQLLSRLVLRPAHRAKVLADRVACAEHFSKMGRAVLIYANDHQDNLPPDLATLVAQERLSEEDLICPATRKKDSYRYCGGRLNVSFPPHVLVAFDRKCNHPGGGRNVLFLDSHVEWVTEDRFQELLAKHNTILKEKGLATLSE